MKTRPIENLSDVQRTCLVQLAALPDGFNTIPAVEALDGIMYADIGKILRDLQRHGAVEYASGWRLTEAGRTVVAAIRFKRRAAEIVQDVMDGIQEEEGSVAEYVKDLTGDDVGDEAWYAIKNLGVDHVDELKADWDLEMAVRDGVENELLAVIRDRAEA